MRIGVDQLDMYEQAARFALQAAIVIPEEKPDVHKVKKAWDTKRPEPSVVMKKGKPVNHKPFAKGEVPLFTPHSRYFHTAKDGFRITDFPEHGEYKLRMKLSAIFPEGYDELPF